MKQSNLYTYIHKWLSDVHGRPNYCEGKNCNGKSTKYDWALKKRHKHEKNIENYLRLCKSCHKKYDVIKKHLFEISWHNKRRIFIENYRKEHPLRFL